MSELKVIEQEQQQSDNVLTVISRAAVDPKVDIDKMERLLVMQESIMDRQARSSFNRDMAKLQAEMPTIAKDGKIMVRD